ncbi:hypothetical protein [Halosimplex marinum]|uniref:hypothetical protein n=1 Tax=Halosimplex marinum TaxID=3396620 RepID=UPI003F566667
MSEVQEDSAAAERSQREGRSNPLVRIGASILIWIRSSFIAFVGTLGTVFLLCSLLLSGLVLPGFIHGILAAMCLVWGVSAYIYAVAGYGLLRLIGYS